MKPLNTKKYDQLLSLAVKSFWKTRSVQKKQQKNKNTGNRAAVTAGKQMDGFIHLLKKCALDAGVIDSQIFERQTQLPGYFRPTKKWDLIVLGTKGELLAAVELKSQVGSFGNNFNNRAEEALGSSLDFWTGFRENLFPNQQTPWLGYFMLMEKSHASTRPVSLTSPHFDHLKEFEGASYLDRYRILGQKLIQERHYSSVGMVWTEDPDSYGNISPETSIKKFLKSFWGYLIANGQEGA